MGVGQTLPDLGPQRIDVPAQVTFALDQEVLEAVRGDQLDPPLGHDPEHHPARGRAEVDRGDGERSLRVPGGRALQGGAHRRNAAATPASTGTWRPVVWERSPAVSANTALATFSGSTSRFSRVRWA